MHTVCLAVYMLSSYLNDALMQSEIVQLKLPFKWIL